MGESACLMHPFSYASGISSETSQGNLMHALGESISFGRFMSESLSWEKWSTFSHRSYVEEAERYAQPGSVAQKKAFFEAHYKSIAAKKAAALLEQANAANNRAETEFKGQDCDIGTTGSESTVNYSQVPADEQLEVQGQSKEEVNRNSNKSNAEMEELKIGEVKVPDSVLEENPTKNESLNRLEFPEMEKLLLEDVKSIEEASFPISEVKPEFSSLKSAVYQKAPQVLATPTIPPAPIYSWRENNVTPLTRKSTIDFAEKKRSTKKSLHELIYSTPARESERENNVTPLARESTIDFTEKKISTKKSLHELIYSTPARESDKSTTPAVTPARESDKSTAPAAQKIESSRVAPSPYKASKDCKTLSTPMTASAEGNHPSESPCSGNRRSKTPLEPSAYGSNTTGPKWHILSAVYVVF
ncbi:TPX2 (targeting protein for Xklp2) protein family [Actinidia rufa]|uniref:TPX2 (Targeting protein for Xklp2) protein family n=1 Tax=Actinidia rufa TaxID=165716 RepID=A0A7J0E9M3_9ERIC|nr:TPX2 (targeting protein for Xklp2) protein family [Actinidia rufa]